MSETTQRIALKTKVTIGGLFLTSVVFGIYDGLVLASFLYIIPVLVILLGYWFFLNVGWKAVSTPKAQRLLLFYAIVQGFVVVFSLIISVLVIVCIYELNHKQNHHKQNHHKQNHTDHAIQIISVHSLIEFFYIVLSALSSAYAYRLYRQRKQYYGIRNDGVYVVNSYTDKFSIQSLYPNQRKAEEGNMPFV